MSKEYYKEVSYFLKQVHGIVYIEKLYWDEKGKPSEKHKAKRLVLGKLGDPQFAPEKWIKKLLE